MIAKEALAVLEAADRWLTAVEAVAADDETRRRTEVEQDALDSAEVSLAEVVQTRRANCGRLKG
jgi:hypothetical protein